MLANRVRTGRRPGGAPYGSDLITGSETYSSDDATLGAAANAANESQADSWSTNNYNSSARFWKVDFGAGNAKYVTRYEMDQFVSNGDAGTVVALQGSNDDTNWTELDSFTGTVNNTSYDRAFNNLRAYRYYRVLFTRDASSGTSTVEIFRMYESTP